MEVSGAGRGENETEGRKKTQSETEGRKKTQSETERYFRSSLPNMASDGLKYQVCSRNGDENEDLRCCEDDMEFGFWERIEER